MDYYLDTSAIILLVEKLKLHRELTKFISKGNRFFTCERIRAEFVTGCYDAAALSFFKRTVKVFPNCTINASMSPFFGYSIGSPVPGELVLLSYLSNKPKRIQRICIVDEELGRNVAKLFGIEYVGSIGFLVELYHCGACSKTQLTRFHSIIKASKFRISKDILNLLINPPKHKSKGRYRVK